MWSGKFEARSFRLDPTLMSGLVLALVSLCQLQIYRPTRHCVHRRPPADFMRTEILFPRSALADCMWTEKFISTLASIVASTQKESRCPEPLRLNRCFWFPHNYVLCICVCTPFNFSAASSSWYRPTVESQSA